MTGLYSINLHIMGRSNIPLLAKPGVITFLRDVNPGLPFEIWLAIVFGVASFFSGFSSPFLQDRLRDHQ